MSLENQVGIELMTKSAVDYAAVIQDLERKRAALNARFDAAIAAIRQVILFDGTEQPELPGLSSPAATQSPALPYRGLTMGDAAIKHLGLIGRPVPNTALAKALVAGGFVHNSKNFANTLNSVLWRRSGSRRDIIKTSEGWALPEQPQ
jgi:hypothetical protein